MSKRMFEFEAPPASSGRFGLRHRGADALWAHRHGRTDHDQGRGRRRQGPEALRQARHREDQGLRRSRRWRWRCGPAPALSPAAPAAKTAKGFDRARFAATIAKITAAAEKWGFELPPGASMEAIEAAEKRLGVTFPDEVRAFYLTHRLDRRDLQLQRARAALARGHRLAVGDLEGPPRQGDLRRQRERRRRHGAGAGEVVDCPVDPGDLRRRRQPRGDPGAGRERQARAYSRVLARRLRTVKGPDFLTWLSKVSWSEEPGDEDDDGDDEDEESGEGAWRRFEVDEKFGPLSSTARRTRSASERSGRAARRRTSTTRRPRRTTTSSSSRRPRRATRNPRQGARLERSLARAAPRAGSPAGLGRRRQRRALRACE